MPPSCRARGGGVGRVAARIACKPAVRSLPVVSVGLLVELDEAVVLVTPHLVHADKRPRVGRCDTECAEAIGHAPGEGVAARTDVNPLGTVLKLMEELTAKVTAEGEAEAAAFEEYANWCKDVNQQTGFEIKAATSLKEKLSAKIADLGSSIQNADTKVEELAADISANEADLEAAVGVRAKEAAEFAAAEKELVEGVDTLKRAVGILEKEMAKNPAALAQIEASSIQSVIQSMGAVVDAAGFSLQDRQHLLAFVQSKQHDDDFLSDSDLGAPAAANYKNKSGGIVDVLTDMKEKAEGELAELRKVENKARNEFALLKGSLEAELANDNKNLGETKKNKAADEESKAAAESDLGSALEDLKKGEESLATANSECMQVAADHQATITARTEELKVIAKAQQIIEETSSGAEIGRAHV